MRKRVYTNIFHSAPNGNRYQTVAAIVFANCFISTICALNGRKVMTWILTI